MHPAYWQWQDYTAESHGAAELPLEYNHLWKSGSLLQGGSFLFPKRISVDPVLFIEHCMLSHRPVMCSVINHVSKFACVFV